MRVIFMGAPAFAVPTLEKLVALGAEIVAVYTKAPKPGGRRGLELTKTAVHEKAEALGLTVLTPKTLRSEEAAAEFAAFRADVAITAAYGLIVPPAILSAPAYGCFNLHGSLLPRWRGAAPIQRAIMAGDAETGVDLMRMEEGLDTGPVAAEARTAIAPGDTCGDLTERLAALAADLVAANWGAMRERRLTFAPQPEAGVTYAKKIEKAETAIDWSRSATEVRCQIHGLSPSPGAFSALPSSAQPERLRVLRAETCEGSGEPGAFIGPDFRIACGTGALRLLEVQRAGKSPAKAADVLRGLRLAPGTRFLPADQSVK